MDLLMLIPNISGPSPSSTPLHPLHSVMAVAWGLGFPLELELLWVNNQVKQKIDFRQAQFQT